MMDEKKTIKLYTSALCKQSPSIPSEATGGGCGVGLGVGDVIYVID